MSNRLPELRRQGTEIAKDFVVPKRGKKKPPKVFITPDLEKKDKLTLRELAWVYNAEVLFCTGLASLFASGVVAALFHKHVTELGLTLNVLWFGGSAILTLLSALESMKRVSGTKHTLSIEQRKSKAFAERQRTKTSHALERYDRYGLGEVEYNHFSTRVTSEGRNVTFALIEHQKVSDEEFVDKELNLDLDKLKILAPEEVATFEEQLIGYEKAVKQYENEYRQWNRRRERWFEQNSGLFPKSEFTAQTGEREPLRPIQPAPPAAMGTKTLHREDDESFDQFDRRCGETKQTYDRIAAALEENAYRRAREQLEVKQIALKLRD